MNIYYNSISINSLDLGLNYMPEKFYSYAAFHVPV